MNKQESLSKTSKSLMLQEPFYGFFLIMLNKVWHDAIGTAAVSKNGINYQLTISEKFWEPLSELHRIGLLKHELLHIAFNHLTTFDLFKDKKLANIAMDMEINQYIDETWLPEGVIDIDDYSELNLKKRAGSRYYYDKLQELQKKKEQNGTCGCENMDKLLDALEKGACQVTIGMPGGEGDKDVNMPNHPWKEFENLPEAEKQLIENQMQRILQEVKSQTEKKQGHVPGEMKGIIKIKEIVPPKFNWKNYLRRFTGISTKIFTKKIRRKENTKFPDMPGMKVKMKQKLMLAIDTSQSVCDDEVREFMNEMHHIYKTGVDITLVQCDTYIRDISEYKGTYDLKLRGRGGTDFTPVIEYFNENTSYTSLVYFTDGEASTHVNPRAKVLWVHSEQSDINEDLPGLKIKLEL
jgi:predicted metal-dependent peptidase